MRGLFYSVLLVLFASGCGRKGVTQLGIASETPPQGIAQLRSLNNADEVSIRGEMIEKCPVAGCWFVVRDATGILKVDTKTAGFVVVDVPLKTLVTVVGRIGIQDSGLTLEATGLRY